MTTSPSSVYSSSYEGNSLSHPHSVEEVSSRKHVTPGIPAIPESEYEGLPLEEIPSDFPPPPSSTYIPPCTTDTTPCYTRFATSKITFLALGVLGLLLVAVAFLGVLLFCLPSSIVIPIFATGAVLIVLSLCFSLYAVTKGIDSRVSRETVVLKLENAFLDGQNNELLAKYNELIDEYNEVVEEQENLKKDYDKLYKDYSAFYQCYVELQAELEQQEWDRKETEAQLADNQQDLESKEAELQQKLVELQNAQTSLQNEILTQQQLKNELASLESSSKALENQIQQLEQLRSSLEEELQKQIDQSTQQQQQKLEQLQKDLENEQKKKEELQNKYSSLEGVKQGLEKQIEQLENESAALKAHKEQLASEHIQLKSSLSSSQLSLASSSSTGIADKIRKAISKTEGDPSSGPVKKKTSFLSKLKGVSGKKKEKIDKSPGSQGPSKGVEEEDDEW